MLHPSALNNAFYSVTITATFSYFFSSWTVAVQIFNIFSSIQLSLFSISHDVQLNETEMCYWQNLCHM